MEMLDIERGVTAGFNYVCHLVTTPLCKWSKHARMREFIFADFIDSVQSVQIVTAAERVLSHVISS